MIARHRSWMPPMKRISTMTVANPFGASVGIHDARDNLEDQAERGDDDDQEGQGRDQIEWHVGERDDRPARPAEVLAQ